MKMMMLLLVSAVVLLVSPAAFHRLDENLNKIIDLVKEYNETLTKEHFVEDLSHLAEGVCEDKFFCKVHKILHKHEHFGKRKEEEELMRNLRNFVVRRSPNCTELLKNVTSTGVKKTIPQLLTYLTACIQHRNFNKGNV